jgi:hypothetical protein
VLRTAGEASGAAMRSGGAKVGGTTEGDKFGIDYVLFGSGASVIFRVSARLFFVEIKGYVTKSQLSCIVEG